jgi:hypothetical protein
MPTPTPVFYDCEASDLEGYPIEVGWAFTDPATGALVSESHLIKPPAEWPVKESWDRAKDCMALRSRNYGARVARCGKSPSA